MKTPQRIIDANANRVREALRVLEETARFIVEDTTLSKRLKQMRHEFVQALPATTQLIAHRDTPSDVGTAITAEAEQTRSGLASVIAAAGSRLSEALRVIEEYSKLDDLGPSFSELAKAAEHVRYQSYDITQQLALALSSNKSPQWQLCLLLTQSLCTPPWRTVLQQAVENGADCIQVREKDMDAGPLFDHVREVITLVDQRAVVIVNDRPDLAKLAGADGVHLGQTDLNPLDARKLLGEQAIIGVSTSNIDQAKRAKADGADYCGVGPMFPTTTKHKPDLAGPAYLQEYLAWDGLPHLAIGGISQDNAASLVDIGCRGLAVSGAICSSQDPAAVSAKLIRTLGNTAPISDSQSGVRPSI